MDTFFSQKICDRCPKPLDVRTMSWFNSDVICMDCSDKETVIKKQLRDKGITGAMEGCGYVPDPNKL